jgi:hypothetical protein
MRWLKRLIFGEDLRDHLKATTKIKAKGMRFTIRRIDPLIYMDGSRVMMEKFAKYKIDKGNADEIAKINTDEIKKHYTDVLMASIVSPELSRKKDDGDKIFVDYLFTDWALANDLYEQIMYFTYGKKKELNT